MARMNVQHDIVPYEGRTAFAQDFNCPGVWTDPWTVPGHTAYTAHFVALETYGIRKHVEAATFHALFGCVPVGGTPMKIRARTMHYTPGGVQVYTNFGTELVQRPQFNPDNLSFRFENEFNAWASDGEAFRYVTFQVQGIGKVYGIRLEMVYDV